MQNINLEDYKGVYVFAQQVDNELSSIAFELLGEAGRLAKPLNTEVTAVLLGSNVGNLVARTLSSKFRTARKVRLQLT